MVAVMTIVSNHGSSLIWLGEGLLFRKSIKIRIMRNVLCQKGWWVIGLLLFIPFVAMQFTTQVVWTWMDFLIAFMLLALLKWGMCFVMNRSFSKRLRLILLGGILVVFVLIWLELAVGIFQSPFAGT
jgi:hypothetical protein